MYTVILNISTTIPACSFSPWSHGNCVGCNAVFVCVSACVCAYRGPTNVAHITCRTIMVNLHFHEPYLLLQLCLWSHPSTMVHVKQRTAAPRCTMLWMYAPFLGPQSRSPGQNLRKTPVPQEPGWPTASALDELVSRMQWASFFSYHQEVVRWEIFMFVCFKKVFVSTNANN